VLQNQRGDWKYWGITRLEHINAATPYCMLWTRAHKNQNGYVERFNRTYREEVLKCYVFETLGEVRRMTAEWLVRYNEHRRHESLGNLSPMMAKSP
jgi:transposase InsO family protein